GKVDHLRMVMQDEPGKDGGPRKHYVLLYDSVPGGTGYLHQLLAQDAQTLADVLNMALEALNTCSCNADPEKDGCYRCLYQYRLGRNMELVSRDSAKAVLSDLVKSLGQLEAVETISDIYINPNFDSVLEARFIESLKRLGGVGPLPVVKLVSDIVNGKSGYVLEVGKQRYRIEPQCELGADHGVEVSSKPDFVIWPWATGSQRRPIAVFCDGWVYHKDTLNDDARKRSAIVNSNAFWVWSVTHQDVVTALDGSLSTDLESPLVAMARHNGSKAPATVPRAQEKAFMHHSVARLLQWLASAESKESDSALGSLQRDALWLSFLAVPSSSADNTACEQQLAPWLHRLPSSIFEAGSNWPGAGYAPYMSKPGQACVLMGRWPLKLAQGVIPAEGWSAPGMVLLDTSMADNAEALHLAWRRWLQLYNTMQVLPGMLLTTAEGLDDRDYDALGVVAAGESVPAQAADHTALQQAWLEALNDVLDELKPGLTALAKAGATVPGVGYELANEKGAVVADAELAWQTEQLAVLRPDQDDLVSVWQAAGWTTLMLDDAYAQVEGRPWAVAIAAALNLTLEPTQELYTEE
ncbi:MAG: DUF1998 domain-containing protein, partial [Alcaligenaceae bacterium]|nr:DUF1998 domain-containing protein [Alcaligenaceae bacterium]